MSRMTNYLAASIRHGRREAGYLHTWHSFSTKRFRDDESRNRARFEAATILGLALGCSLERDPDTWPTGLRNTWDSWIEDVQPRDDVTFGEAALWFSRWRVRQLERFAN